MKPEAIEYKLDYWTINFYAVCHGRDDQSCIAVINWTAELPHKRGATYTERFDNKSVSEHFDNYEEALKWVKENTK